MIQKKLKDEKQDPEKILQQPIARLSDEQTPGQTEQKGNEQFEKRVPPQLEKEIRE